LTENKSVESKPSQLGLSRFQLLLGLTGLAFTTITAGVGLMQAYYSAKALLAMNSTRFTSSDLSLINKQANILFPIGQFLLIVGLAIIFSILLQSVFYLKPWFKHAGWKGIAFVVIVSGAFVGWEALHSSTYAGLWADLELHQHTLPIFLFATALFTVGLYFDGRSSR